MRRLACAAATFVLIASVACRKQQSNASAGGTDETVTSSTTASAPAAAMPDTAAGAPDFSFDQRQVFARSIRQQLGDVDRQIGELSALAKSRGGAVSDRALANIRASRRAVDRSLSRVETASAANWDQIKQGINRALDNLSESIEAAQPK